MSLTLLAFEVLVFATSDVDLDCSGIPQPQRVISGGQSFPESDCTACMCNSS